MECPHCQKVFEKLAALVNDSNMVRETYYACPHCGSKVEIDVNTNMLKFAQKGKDASPPTTQCPYYFGYLSLFCKGGVVPETCLTCTLITRCMTEMKKET